MGRSRYTITEPDKPHFMTCTVLEWLPVFTRPETVQMLASPTRTWRPTALRLRHLRKPFTFYCPNEKPEQMREQFQVIYCAADYRPSASATRWTVIGAFTFFKTAHKTDREYQFWQEGVHAELVFSETMMREKLDYIHANPVKRGYVNSPEHWRYSSAANYAGLAGLIDVDLWWKRRWSVGTIKTELQNRQRAPCPFDRCVSFAI